METKTREWLSQSDYDIDTALYMLEGGRYIYTVFMCHLSIEKALKGLYYEKLRKVPPKSHNLIYILNEIGVKPPEKQGRSMVKINEASIPTRYPENLTHLQQIYSESVARSIMTEVKEILTWIKEQL